MSMETLRLTLIPERNVDKRGPECGERIAFVLVEEHGAGLVDVFHLFVGEDNGEDHAATPTAGTR
jgi:hypothetical protein